MGLGDFFSNPLGWAKDQLDDAADFITNDIPEYVEDVGGEIISWIVPDIPSIPTPPPYVPPPSQPISTPATQNIVDQAAQGALINKESNVAQIPVIYGTRRAAGVRVFVETSGSKNKFLYMAIVLCEGEVDSIGDVYIDDTLIDGSPYESYMTIEKKVGTDDQEVSATLLEAPSWSETDTLSGLAYLAVKITYNRDVFTRIPNITAIVNGRKVYDPRDGTTAHSTNPALCLRDYLTNERYGKGLDATLLDDQSFQDAADTCETQVETYSGSGEYINRFDTNAMIDTGSSLFGNVQFLLTSMQGLMPFQDGKYKLKIDDDYDSTFDFTTDNILGGISITSVDKNSRANRVVGKFINPEANWQGDTVTWPDAGSSDETTFLAEDNGVVLEKQFSLLSVTSYYQARNIIKTFCLQSRKSGLKIQFDADSSALQCAVGDIVTVTHPTPAWTSKEFRIIAMSISFKGTVSITAAEHNATIYPWVDDKEEPATFAANLPNPLTVDPISLTVSDELRSFNEEAISILIANVDTTDAFIERFEVQAQLEGTSTWINMGLASGGQFELPNVQDGRTYTVRAKGINTIGVSSAYTTVEYQVIGKTAPPSDVTGLTGNLIGNQYFLTWNAVPDLDLSHYRVRFASEDVAPTYQNSISLVPKVSRPATSVFVPARNGKYFVKAIDKLGLASETPATVTLSSNIDKLDNYTGVQTITESPDYNGTFDDTVEVDEEDRIILDTSLNFDDVTGNFDDAEGLFDGGAGNVDASGYYYFGQSADLNQVFLTRVTSVLKQTRVDYVTLFDSSEGLFDDRAGNFDGDVNAFDDVDVIHELRYTEDDPSASPTWSDWQPFTVTDIKARGFEFRCKLTTTDTQATPAITSLAVQLDMGVRTESGEDVVSGAGAKVVTFPTAFANTPAIGIGAQDLQTGDYYQLSSKSRTGFTITFYDSTDTAVSRTFDYVAKGYGQEVT